MIRGMARTDARHALLLSLTLLAVGQPAPAPAQEVPDSAQVAAADSARARVLLMLERLSTPPLPDSLRELPDTLSPEAQRASQPSVGADPDSVYDALTSLPGYEISRYEGTRVEFGADRQLTLFGSSEAQARFFRDGAERVELVADSSIIFSEGTGLLRTRGESVFTPQGGDPVTSRTMVYDLGLQRGSAYEARTQYSEGANWIVSGDLPSVTPELVFGDDVGFTSCDLEHPHYRFQTDQIKIVGGSVLVARPVRLYFEDVPVLWLPFIAQSLGDGRTSGLLTPRFSVNDIVRSSTGYSRRVSNLGFYWAMSDYTDASLAMDWWSDNYVGVTGTFSYNWLRQFLRGSVNFRNFWRASGGKELAFNTRHNWEFDERTQFRMSASYASSTDFIRQNSFDPREVTQSIDSDGGLNRRFDWGSLSMSANRRQFLSDDRVTMTLPSANLSLNPITLFAAPSSQAGWYNNLTWTGSGNYTRSIESRMEQHPDSFQVSLADKVNTRAGFSNSLSLGALSWSQSVNMTEAVVREGLELVVEDIGLDPTSAAAMSYRDLVGVGFGDFTDPSREDLSEADLTWSQNLSYQQRLIGTTTLTPTLSISGRARRSNDIQEATSFVSAPSRLSFGAGLKTDLYGLWPGFAGFSAIRHKLTPGADYSYAPQVTQTEVQDSVFGFGEFRAKNEVRFRLNQTFEAKREEDPSTAEEEAVADTATGPRRQQRAEIVQLLALQTSAVNYDFVRADSTGRFSDGFTTTRLSNQISSDFLRGLQISTDHELFDDGLLAEGGERKFSPHLSSANLSFALNSQSSIFRWIGALTGQASVAPPDEESEEEEFLDEEDPFAPVSGVDESQVLPGARDDSFMRTGVAAQPRTARGGRRSGWNANVSYSLQRPRGNPDQKRQMLQATFRFKPTELWGLNWRTSYDVEEAVFNDHMISLTRDLHRWEASFDFRQTATGNWSFRFEVSLIDNRDLKFDYEQRDQTDLLGSRPR